MNRLPAHYATTTDGHRIAYTVSGSGLPFIQGPIGFNHVQAMWELPGWARLHRSLETRFRVINFDHRGQGMSTRGLSRVPTAADYQQDIEAIVQRLDLAPIVLFGMTGLAHVALRYASLNPSRVLALVTWNAKLEREPTPTMQFGKRSAKDWDSFLFALASAMPLEDATVVKRTFEQSMNFDDFSIQAEALESFTLADIAWPIEVPTLVLGSRSGSRAVQFERDCKHLASLIPDSQMLLFDDPTGGLDAPEGQACPALLAIEQFLAALPNSSTSLPTTLTLSSRELEIVRLIAIGRTNRQIAEQLVISLNTVQNHVSRILTKSELSNRTQVAAYAHGNGLI